VSADPIGQTLSIPDAAPGLPHLKGIARTSGPARRPDGSIGMSISRPRGGGTPISLRKDLRQKETLSIDGGGTLSIGALSRKTIHETKTPIASTGKNLQNVTENPAGRIEKARRCGHVAGAVVLLLGDPPPR
jgi:hypothetical protein